MPDSTLTRGDNKYTALSASGLVVTGPGRLVGFVIAASSSLTLKAWDNTAGSGTVIFDTTAAITAPTSLNCHSLAFTNGLFITIGGSGSYTVVWHPVQ